MYKVHTGSWSVTELTETRIQIEFILFDVTYWAFLNLPNIESSFFLRLYVCFNTPCGVSIITQHLVLFLEFQPEISTRTRRTWNLKNLPKIYANNSKFPVNNTLMSKFTVNNTLMSKFTVNNTLMSKFSLSQFEMFQIKAIEFHYRILQFSCKILVGSFTLYVPKNTFIWAITESAHDDQKLGDYTYEDFDMKYTFLKGNVKKCSNYVWRKSFITWIFAANFAGIKFPISLINAKPQNSLPSKICDMEELSSNSDCVTLIWVGFLGVRFAIAGAVGKIPYLSKSC